MAKSRVQNQNFQFSEVEKKKTILRRFCAGFMLRETTCNGYYTLLHFAFCLLSDPIIVNRKNLVLCSLLYLFSISNFY